MPNPTPAASPTQNWHERKMVEMQLLLSTESPKMFRSYQAYTRYWKRRFERAGFVPFKAVVDYAGNCVYCGEAGRCVGWHIYDGRMDQVADTKLPSPPRGRHEPAHPEGDVKMSDTAPHTICLDCLQDKSICSPPYGTWRIGYEPVPPEANYVGPLHADILRNTGPHSWNALGHLMLSANPECLEALQEMAKLANQTQAQQGQP